MPGTVLGCRGQTGGSAVKLALPLKEEGLHLDCTSGLVALFLPGSVREAVCWPEPRLPPGTNLAISPSGQLGFGVPGDSLALSEYQVSQSLGVLLSESYSKHNPLSCDSKQFFT